MLAMLSKWQGNVQINDKDYNTIQEAANSLKLAPGEQIHIKLLPLGKKPNQAGNSKISNEDKDDAQEYRITVAKWMTEKSSGGFDFLLKWNNDVPMPLRVMTGYIDRETPGMYHMVLHGDIYAEKICTCMKCGKRLTNPVSQFFGIGPECGGHNYTHPFDTDEELQQAVAQYKKKLQETTWTGWIAKKAIQKQEEV